jgi:hypothetical protein
MSVIARTVLRLAAGLLACHLVTGQSGRSRRTNWFALR